MSPLILRLQICADGRFEDSKFRDCAGNLGNAVIDEGLKGFFPNARVGDLNLKVKSKKSRRLAVFSLANYLSAVPPTRAGRMFANSLLAWLDENEITPVVLSVGMQFSHFDTSFLVHPERIEFVKQLSKRARFIGTRGHVTSYVLACNGINNTWAVGDPGILWHECLRPRESGSSSASDISTGFLLSGYNRSFCQRFAVWELRQNSRRIVQSVDDGAFRIAGTSRARLRNGLLKWLLWPTTSEKMISSYGRHFRTNAVVPCGIADWKKSLSSARLVATMRIHGLAIARSMGCHTVLIRSDLRTSELAEFHKLPSIDTVDFDSKTEVQELILHSAAIEQASKERSIECLANMRDFLRALDVDLSSTVMSRQPDSTTTTRQKSGKDSLLKAFSIIDGARSHPLASHVDLLETAPMVFNNNTDTRNELLRRLGFETDVHT